MTVKELTYRVRAHDPEEQNHVKRVLEDLRKEHPEVSVKIESESKKLVPQEVVLSIGITVASEILAVATLSFLDKLWKRLEKHEKDFILSSLDSAQRKAEKYLLDMGISDIELSEREDKGLYALFVFRSKKASYRLHISKADLQIIKFKKG